MFRNEHNNDGSAHTHMIESNNNSKKVTRNFLVNESEIDAVAFTHAVRKKNEIKERRLISQVWKAVAAMREIYCGTAWVREMDTVWGKKIVHND